ncbi:MAG TPA: coproporphyrinogen-III oxidase family protein [Bryobacteraceae bacterium]|nr:coproporphyrinogen-III oxidase family protein [Bryobacteraceae bacterium]
MPGVYVSYPFCAQKCTYCNFASGVFPQVLETRYLEALRAEIQQHQWDWRPETVYLGGGTPSAMDPEALASVLARIPGSPWQEATIEAAPGSITPDKARAWRELGIDRVSLGVQSFVSTELSRTGRKHAAQTVAADVAMLRAASIHKINIDLIAGLPGQTEASWRESLDWIARLAPDHVSVYMLEVDDDSRLGREILAGGARYGAGAVPSADLTADLYETAVLRLAGLGLARYEISNFALPARESRHNMKYWLFEPYAGFGSDAHSFDGRLRWQNPESINDYLGAWQAVRAEANPLEERFFVGLRLTRGIRPEPREWERFGDPIRRFLEQGLLETEDGVLRLTARGIMLSNEVFEEFLI